VAATVSAFLTVVSSSTTNLQAIKVRIECGDQLFSKGNVRPKVECCRDSESLPITDVLEASQHRKRQGVRKALGPANR